MLCENQWFEFDLNVSPRHPADPKDQESKEKVYRACSRFWERFEKEFKSCYCYDLIGCRLDDEGERQRWLAAGGMEKCAELVEKTALMLYDFIDEIG